MDCDEENSLTECPDMAASDGLIERLLDYASIGSEIAGRAEDEAAAANLILRLMAQNSGALLKDESNDADG